MSDCEKANDEFPKSYDIWKNKETGIEYEIICVTNTYVSTHDKNYKVKMIDLQSLINDYIKV